MRNLKMFTAVAAVALSMAAVGVSSASAVTFDGTISGSTWVGAVGPCDFSITASAGAPTSATMTGSSFAGRADGPNDPCDESSLSIENNISVSYTNAMTGALASGIRVHDNDSGCDYTTNSAITISNDTTLGNDGLWSGSGSATSSNFPCLFAPATISVSAGKFTT